MKKVLTCIIIMTMILCITPVNIVMAAKNVNVTIPTFPVTLNGHYIDNTYSQYPLIVYNNITYIPMTYGYAHFMGLSTSYDARSRSFGVWLDTERTYDPGIITTYIPNNRSSYTAVVADYDITINQTKKVYNSSSNQYPVLNFRDVTYFPLTWEYIVEDFGWNYTFTTYGGLNIQQNLNNPYVNPKIVIGEWDTTFNHLADYVDMRIKITNVDTNAKTITIQYKIDEDDIGFFNSSSDKSIDQYPYEYSTTLNYHSKGIKNQGMVLVTDVFSVPGYSSYRDKMTIMISSKGNLGLSGPSGEVINFKMTRR